MFKIPDDLQCFCLIESELCIFPLPEYRMRFVYIIKDSIFLFKTSYALL